MILFRNATPERHWLMTLMLLISIALSTVTTHADLLDLDDDEMDDLAMIDEEEGLTADKDYNLLANSTLLALSQWQGVITKTNTNGTWAAQGGSVSPKKEGSISQRIAIPESGKYHIWLRLKMLPEAACPGTLTFTQKDTNKTISLTFGEEGFPRNVFAKELDKRMAVFFDELTDRIAIPSKPMMAWQCLPAELEKGEYIVSLETKEKRFAASHLFMTQSSAFRPTLTQNSEEKVFGRLFLRYRMMPANEDAHANFTVGASLTYHWGRPDPKSSQPLWGYSIPTSEPAAAGEWTPFVDATDAIIPGGGPWSTCRFGVSNIQKGSLEIQFAWFPDEGAVCATTKTAISAGSGMIRVPHRWGAPTPDAEGARALWGIYDASFANRIIPENVLVAQYFGWANDARKALGLEKGALRPKSIMLHSGCKVSEGNRDEAVKMLASLGINSVEGASDAISNELGLWKANHVYNTYSAAAAAARLTPEQIQMETIIKTGDEINTFTSASEIERSPLKKKKFADYLSMQAALYGETPESFYGTARLIDLPCLGSLPANAGRFERRLFYAAQRFGHIITTERYMFMRKQFESVFPNVLVYNNYTPHTVFLTGNTMNQGDWFVMARSGAQSLGWGEDWATGGSWGLNSDYQVTSFYAAMVACSTRTHGAPNGFYVGVNCGAGDRKIFSCVGNGLKYLHLYDWGPMDSWAEGNNAWSENRGEYKNVASAANALGFCDDIIGEGSLEKPKTAILYNRSHEILHGGYGQLNHDWVWTYIGLRSAQVPVDIIIEEDLNAEALKQYKLLFVGGMALESRHVKALDAWVREGGCLVGNAGAGMTDVFRDPMPESTALFGATQRGTSEGEATVSINAFEGMDATTFKVPGIRFALDATDAKTIGTHASGQSAIVTHAYGKGRTVLLGFCPGFAVRDNGRRTGAGRNWLAQLARYALKETSVTFTYPHSEVARFDSAKGTAVLVTRFAAAWGNDNPQEISVAVNRPVASVRSAYAGDIAFTEKDGRVYFPCPLLQNTTIEAIVIRYR